MVELRRVELLTSCLQGRRTSQLSYSPKLVLINVLFICKIRNFNFLFYDEQHKVLRKYIEK